MSTAALNVFSMLGGGLPSLMANVNANPSNFIPQQASQYQASRDPMSKQYDAETYDKSYLGSALDTMFGKDLQNKQQLLLMMLLIILKMQVNLSVYNRVSTQI